MKDIKEVIIPCKCNTINIHYYPNISSIIVHGNNTNSVIITNCQRIILITFQKETFNIEYLLNMCSNIHININKYLKNIYKLSLFI